MLPSLESLRCFTEAARLLNFRAAARSVGLTPAALGQRIRQLEEQLETKLFHRTTRSVVLTQAGFGLLPLAQQTIDSARRCLQPDEGQAAVLPLDLVVGTRHELGMSWLVPMLPQLEQCHPGMTLHLYFSSGADLVLHVRSLAIDCAVTSTRLTDPKLDSSRLHREDYVFVGAHKLLQQFPLKTPDQAAEHTLFDTTEDLPLFRYWRDAPGGLDSLRFRRVVRLGAIAAIRYAVLRGEGVAVLPSYYVAQDLKAKRLAKIQPKVKPQFDYFRLVYRKDDPRRSIYESMAATMMQNVLK